MNKTSYSLTNHFLVAMPVLTVPYFNRSVIYVCEHNDQGAVGIMVNQPLLLNLSDVFQQMEITTEDLEIGNVPVLFGGPMHGERGFVIHKSGGHWRSSLAIQDTISITTSRDILRAIAKKRGPDQIIISLGYASWGAGQLEKELADNLWLTVPVSPDILFEIPFGDRWTAALHTLGIRDVNNLAYYGGRV